MGSRSENIGPPPPDDEAVNASTTKLTSGQEHYKKVPYALPELGTLYCVRDKSGAERIIQVTEKSPDGTHVQVQTIEAGQPSSQSIQIAVNSLGRQAAKGWCCVLVPIAQTDHAAENPPAGSSCPPPVAIRLDIQNFSRCCADIVRANIKFDTQLIKDLGDGPFRSGNYEQAFRTLEQYAIGFSSAVNSSRRTIAEGRRKLTAEKGKLSGKEIQERSAAFTRSEHLIHTAEREFSTILEGLRMYLRAQQGSDTLSSD
jgi:hypothetical protein